MTRSHNEELKIGDRIGRYEILSVIGQGSMGMVYKCRHDVLGRVVAIKTLRLKASTDERTQKRFVREAQMANRLDHPNLISLIDFGNMSNGDPYLVMEYVSGHSLYEIIKRGGRLQPQRVVNLFSQICEGLYHAHQRGVIHRDLKPANMLVISSADGSETVKIVDLGVAKIVHGWQEEDAEAITMTGEVCGSPIYLSPEQCLYHELDARTDIYSLGVCMYECLTGSPPLRGATVYDTIYMHVHDTPQPFAAIAPGNSIPRKLEEIVFNCLSKKPSDRYETMMQVRHELLNSLKAQTQEEAAVNVLPPDLLGLSRPSARKTSAELPNTALAGADNSTQISGQQSEHEAAEDINFPQKNTVRERSVRARKEIVEPEITGTAGEFTKMVIVLALAFLLIGLGIGFGFAYMVTQSNQSKNQVEANAGASKPVPQTLSNPVRRQDPNQNAKTRLKTASPEKRSGKNSSVQKTSKSSSNDLERILRESDGSQGKYFSIVKKEVPSSGGPEGLFRTGSTGTTGNRRFGRQELEEKFRKGAAILGQIAKSRTVDAQHAVPPVSIASAQQAQSGNGLFGFPAQQSPPSIPIFGAPPSEPANPPQAHSASPAHAAQIEAEEQAAILSNEGTQLWKSGHYLDSARKFEAAHKLLPNNENIKGLFAVALNSRAFELNKRGKYAEAVDCCKRAIELSPHNASYERNLHNYTQNLENQKAGLLPPAN